MTGRTDETPSIHKILDIVHSARDNFYASPPVGHPENPFVMLVPGWLEDRCVAQGFTSQEWADENIRYAVKVEVVR